MKSAAFVLALMLIPSEGFSLGWRFIGPDSVAWRYITQMDVSFRPGRVPYVGVGTGKGIAAKIGGAWQYVLRNYYNDPFPPQAIEYRSVYFSPWNDSVAFIGYNVYVNMEPGSVGGRVENIYQPAWPVAGGLGGGFVGQSPNLAFQFSSRHPNHVYAWIIDLYKSTNNGLSWYHYNPVSYGSLFLSLDLTRDSVLYAGIRLQQSGIYRSTDDGSSWTMIRPLSLTPTLTLQRNADMIANGDTLVLASNRFPLAADTTCGISVSTNGGATWFAPLPTMNVQKITRDRHAPHLWYAAAQGGIYRSVNGGVSWQLLTDSLPSLNVVDIRKDPYSDTLYIATSDLGVYQVFDLPVEVEEAPQQPGEFALMQNYPNPFNPTTQIPFSVRESGFVSLKVYDVLGREVRTLVNQNLQPGSYEVTFDATGLASGVYVYRMSVLPVAKRDLIPTSRDGQAGSFVQTRKLIVVR